MSTLPEDEHLPVTITGTVENFSGFRTVRTYTYTEDASQLTAKREIVNARSAIAVVAFDPKLEQLVMIRQFRLGAQLETGRGMCIEIAAGLIDPGEEPAEAARRELIEETGLEALSLQPLCRFLPTPGMTDESIHLFLAEVDASNLSNRAGAENETEETFPFLVTLDDALVAIDQNKIANGIAMLALLWFSRHREQLLGEDRT